MCLLPVSQGVFQGGRGFLTGRSFSSPISRNSVNQSQMFILEWQSDGFGFFFFFSLFFKLVHLGELRFVYLGIRACLVIEDKLSDLFWLPFGTHFTIPFLFMFEGLVKRKKANIKDSVYNLWFKVR